MRGILQRNRDSKIYADGRTYDSKLYTFKECDYTTIWHALDIMVKPLDMSAGKPQIRNISPPKAQQEKKDRIDKALEKEGVPYPADKVAATEEDLSSSSSGEDDLINPDGTTGNLDTL